MAASPMVPLVPCTRDDVPRLIVKVQYPQICVPVSETDLDDLLKQLREKVSGYVVTLRASVSTNSTSYLRSAVHYAAGWDSPPTYYCKTAPDKADTRSLNPTLLIEVLSNRDNVSPCLLETMQKTVHCALVKSNQDIQTLLVKVLLI